MHPIDALGHPVRRRILEFLRDSIQTAGGLTLAIQDEFGITQPAVSRHLRILRESRLVSVQPEGATRIYAIEPTTIAEVDAWIELIRPRRQSPRAART